MRERGVVGLGVARIEGGEVQELLALGQRSRERAEPLQPDSVLYAASLTKLVTATAALQLAEEGRLDLDAPLTRLLPQPLPAYPDWAQLAGDARWQRLTPRLLLSHQSGLPNWRWMAPDRVLRFDHAPGTRYAYSGEGIQILQTVLEQERGDREHAEMRRRLGSRPEPPEPVRVAVVGEQQRLVDQHGRVPHRRRAAEPRQGHPGKHRLHQEQQERAGEDPDREQPARSKGRGGGRRRCETCHMLSERRCRQSSRRWLPAA